MGCSTSHNVYEMATTKRSRSEFGALRLSQGEVVKLYHVFRKADVDNSGSIVLLELLDYLDIERTRFSERVFSVFDENGSGAIDFREFVLACWSYCTLSRATLDLFAFDLYDCDSSGCLSVNEIRLMMKDLYGDEVTVNHNAKSMFSDLMAIERMGHFIDAQHFCNFCKTHSALLFPAFRMQQTLQKATLGCDAWSRIGQRRIDLSKGRNLSVAQFMMLHLDDTLREQVTCNPTEFCSSAHSSLSCEASLALTVSGTVQQRTCQHLRRSSCDEPVIRRRSQHSGTTTTAAAAAAVSPTSLLNEEDMFLLEMTVAAAETLATDEVKILKGSIQAKERMRSCRRDSEITVRIPPGGSVSKGYTRRKSSSILPEDCVVTEAVTVDASRRKSSVARPITLEDRIAAIERRKAKQANV